MFGTPEFQATAKLDRNGDLIVKVTASCAYGSRETSRSVDVTLDEKDEKTIKAILAKAAEEATVEVTIKTKERDEDGELKVDENGYPLKKTNVVPLTQKVFSDAAEAFTLATNSGEKV
jgi:hypothetical protein